MYKYFLFSKEYLEEQNRILSARGKQLVPGIVTTGGAKHQFIKASSSPSIPRFFDTVVVAEGDTNQLTIINPKIERKGSL